MFLYSLLDYTDSREDIQKWITSHFRNGILIVIPSDSHFAHLIYQFSLIGFEFVRETENVHKKRRWCHKHTCQIACQFESHSRFICSLGSTHLQMPILTDLKNVPINKTVALKFDQMLGLNRILMFIMGFFIWKFSSVPACWSLWKSLRLH